MKSRTACPIRDNAGTLSGDIAPVTAHLNVVCSPGDPLAVERGDTERGLTAGRR